MKNKKNNLDTRIIHAGSDTTLDGSLSSPPVSRASTVFFSSGAEFEQHQRNKLDTLFYGRLGTPTSFAFEQAMADLEGGYKAVAVCSGTAAVSGAILSFVRSGDHILLPDTVWGPIRDLCNGLFATLGIEVSYYDPMAPAALEAQIRHNTRVLYLESPGSVTYEVQDVPACVAVAKKHNLITMIDNTWASPVFFRPLALGVDVSIIAATKFIVGHSDVVIGVIVASEACYPAIRKTSADLGYHASPDDCYLAHRGLKSAALRMRQHEKQGLELAHWLTERPEVERVLHPALADHPGHAVWRRDFSGSSGVFGVVLKPMSAPAINALLSNFSVFSIGASWGGLQSIIIQSHPERVRTINPWLAGPTLRIHTGLEDIEDLKSDLLQAFDRARRAADD